jgi:hypothetical protein
MKPLYLEVFSHSRYFEDSQLNGRDDVEVKMPCITVVGTERRWNPLINLKTGVIENWEIGNVASISYKVCDQGLYFLQFEKGVRALKWNNWYVPGKYLSQNDEGWGDYIIMDIDVFGKIKDWKEPEFNPKEWIGIDEEITGNNQ